MKTLAQVKKEVLDELGYENESDFIQLTVKGYDTRLSVVIDAIATGYAKEAVKALGNSIKDGFEE